MTDDRTMSTFAAVTHDGYVQDLEYVARSLERLAQKVREQADPSRPGSHVESAQRAVHAVMWGMANLSLDGLIHRAEVADEAARAEALAKDA